MAGFQGMDPVVLRGIAERMRTQAALLDDVLVTVQRTVDEAISLWDGDDAHGFNGWWTSHYRPALSAAHQSLVGAAAAIERNVNEQERASGVGGAGGAAGSSGPRGVTPQEYAAAQAEIDRLIREGILQPTFVGADAVALFAELSKHTDLSTIRSLDDLASAVNKMELSSPFKGAGGPFAVLQFGLSAYDLNAAIHSSNEPDAWRAGLDMSLGTAASFVPGGGIAWWGGTKIGEGLYWFGQDVVGLDTPNVGYNYAIESTFGPGVRAEDLTPEQTQILTDRYEGWTGIIMANGDAINGHWNQFTDAVSWWD